MGERDNWLEFLSGYVTALHANATVQHEGVTYLLREWPGDKDGEMLADLHARMMDDKAVYRVAQFAYIAAKNKIRHERLEGRTFSWWVIGQNGLAQNRDNPKVEYRVQMSLMGTEKFDYSVAKEGKNQ